MIIIHSYITYFKRESNPDISLRSQMFLKHILIRKFKRILQGFKIKIASPVFIFSCKQTENGTFNHNVKTIDYSMYVSFFSYTTVAHISLMNIVHSGYKCIPLFAHSGLLL